MKIYLDNNELADLHLTQKEYAILKIIQNNQEFSFYHLKQIKTIISKSPNKQTLNRKIYFIKLYLKMNQQLTEQEKREVISLFTSNKKKIKENEMIIKEIEKVERKRAVFRNTIDKWSREQLIIKSQATRKERNEIEQQFEKAVLHIFKYYYRQENMKFILLLLEFIKQQENLKTLYNSIENQQLNNTYLKELIDKIKELKNK